MLPAIPQHLKPNIFDKPTGLGTNCVETSFQVTSLKERLEGREGEEGDIVSSCWMTSRKQEDTGS
jgi:hypothetical protein